MVTKYFLKILAEASTRTHIGFAPWAKRYSARHHEYGSCMNLKWPIAFALALVSLAAAQTASREDRYLIQPLDVIDLTFRYTPEYNHSVTVQPDGFVSMHSIGDLKVAGMSVPDVSAIVKAKYAAFLRDPVVTLSLRDIAKPAVTVGGFVAKPGRIDLRGPTSLTDVIAMAGGFNAGAKDTEVLLFRRAGGELVEVRKVNVKNLLEKGNIEEDIPLHGGDAIYVSKGKIAKIDRFMQVSRLGLYFNPIPTFTSTTTAAVAK